MSIGSGSGEFWSHQRYKNIVKIIYKYGVLKREEAPVLYSGKH